MASDELVRTDRPAALPVNGITRLGRKIPDAGRARSGRQRMSYDQAITTAMRMPRGAEPAARFIPATENPGGAATALARSHRAGDAASTPRGLARLPPASGTPC